MGWLVDLGAGRIKFELTELLCASGIQSANGEFPVYQELEP